MMPDFELSRTERLVWFVKRLGLPTHYNLKFADGTPWEAYYLPSGGHAWWISPTTRVSPRFRFRLLCLLWGRGYIRGHGHNLKIYQ